MSRRADAPHVAAAVAVLVVEVLLYRQYAELGTQFHFWLHLLLGGWLGVAALTGVELVRAQRRVRPFEAAFLGHTWSAVPDVLFLAAGVVHVAWQDVFALHITAHFLWPDALGAASALWVLAVAALVCVRTGRRTAGAALLAGSVVLLGASVLLRSPLPDTLEEVRQLERSRGLAAALADSPWQCRVATVASSAA